MIHADTAITPTDGERHSESILITRKNPNVKTVSIPKIRSLIIDIRYNGVCRTDIKIFGFPAGIVLKQG